MERRVGSVKHCKCEHHWCNKKKEESKPREWGACCMGNSHALCVFVCMSNMNTVSICYYEIRPVDETVNDEKT